MIPKAYYRRLAALAAAAHTPLRRAAVARRLAALEAMHTTPKGEGRQRRNAILWIYAGEDAEATIAAWHAEHPTPPGDNGKRDGTRLVVFHCPDIPAPEGDR